jgi:hypothetical protein
MKFLDVPQSGSIAGTTHSHNRAGQYTRNRRSPVQPVGTGRRAIVRANFATASAGWAGLTTVQREAWNSFADSHPITDSLGQAVVLTGHQMYVRVNSTSLNVGMGFQVAPPVDLALPDLSAVTFAFSVATGVSIDAFSGDPDAVVAVGLSRPMSAGRGFNKTFWQPLGTDGYVAADSAPFGLTTAKYAAEFGAPAVGQKVFARLTPISTDAWNGTGAIVSTIVVA